LTRHLNSAYHDSIPSPSAWQWQKPDGSLDMDSLLREFQKFWRRHSEINMGTEIGLYRSVSALAADGFSATD
jgi:hypothetical protein